jgi:hypothetical protein
MIRFFSIGKHSLIWQRGFRWVLTDQLWFWSDEWQAGERESEADYKAGRFETFDSIDDFIKSLESTGHETGNEAETAWSEPESTL